jgi:hypothetical protein
MKTIKLSETQIKIIKAEQDRLKVMKEQKENLLKRFDDEIKRQQQRYEASLVLIAGEEFTEYEIKGKELIIKPKPKKKDGNSGDTKEA